MFHWSPLAQGASVGGGGISLVFKTNKIVDKRRREDPDGKKGEHTLYFIVIFPPLLIDTLTQTSDS